MVWYDYQSALGLDETVNEAGLNPELIGRWVQEKHPKSGWNGIGASYKVRPDDKEVASLGPDFQHHWNQNFVHGAPRPLTQGFFFLG
jgi:alcohol oxidase